MSHLPIGWSRSRLGDVATDIGYGFTTASTTVGDRPKLLRITDIQNGSVNWETVPRCTDEPDERTMLGESDIVIARTGATTGKSYLIRTVPEKAVFASYLIRVRLSAAVDPAYVWSFMQSRDYWSQIQTVAKGTAQPGANASILSSLSIPVASLPEQRRIVAKIDSLTDKSRRARDYLDHIPRLVEKYKQAILAAAFRGDLTREWREANGLPSFQSVRLPELLAEPIRNGLSVRGSDTPPGVRALRLSALRGGTVDLSDVRFLPITDDQSARFLLREGDVLVSRGNGTKAFVGLAALVGAVEFPTIFPDTAFRLRPTPSTASPSWLALIWNAPPMREQIERAAKTTAGIWKISQGNLNEIDILLPSPAEQTEIVRRISSAFDWIDRLFKDASSARKLVDHLDQAVLAKAFKGELVPQDPADESASALLDRIRAERAAAPKAKRGRKKAA